MSRPYPGEDFDDAADRLADEDVQRGVDDRWEEQLMAAKRNAHGASVEELTLLDAYVEGRRAGREGLSAEMNRHPEGSAKRKAWERGRITALGQSNRRAA